MTSTKKITFYWLLLFLSNLFAAFLFSKGVKSLYPVFYLALAVGGLGIVLSLILSLVLKLFGDSLQGALSFILILVFQVIQVALAFCLSYFLFRLPALYGVAYIASALIGLLAICLLPKLSGFAQNILAALLGALALTISLRIGGVFLACFSGFLFLNLLPLGLKLLPLEEKFSFAKTLSFWSLLVVGRAALQYYLLESGYDVLGVVVSHPYSFAALFAGFALPFLYSLCSREEKFPRFALLVLLGLILPFVLGLIFHSRPMAGFLMGLICAAYWIGFSEPKSEDFILAALMAFAVVALALPLFKISLTFTRGISLGVLSGAALVISAYSAVLFGIWRRRR